MSLIFTLFSFVIVYFPCKTPLNHGEMAQSAYAFIIIIITIIIIIIIAVYNVWMPCP